MKTSIISMVLSFMTFAVIAQEKQQEFKGTYLQLSNQFELIDYYPEEEGLWESDTYQNVGFDIGKYNGAQSYGISISHGFDDQNSDYSLDEGEREYNSYWRLTGVFQNRIIGTKTASKFRLHLGGIIQGGVQRTLGEEGAGSVRNQQTGQYSYPVKSINRTDLLIGFAPYLEIGGRVNRGSIHLNSQPLGVYFSTHGIGLIVAKIGLIVQL